MNTPAITVPLRVQQHAAASPELFHEGLEPGDDALVVFTDDDDQLLGMIGRVKLLTGREVGSAAPIAEVLDLPSQPLLGAEVVAAPVGHDGSDRHRPAYGQRVLVLGSRFFPERVGEVVHANGANRDGTVRVTALQGRRDTFDILRWALLPGVELNDNQHRELVVILASLDARLSALGLGIDAAPAIIGGVLEPFDITVSRRAEHARPRVEWPTHDVPGANG